MLKKNRKYQIGVMGSAADLNYSKDIEQIAENVGRSRGAKKEGGTTVGITYGKGLDIFENEFTDVIIASGLERGGGRETALVLSCDAIIAISGGSGTLTEMVIAYQANIPIVAIEGTGGWAEKMANQYFDARKRIKVETSKNAEDAVKKALKLIEKKGLK